MGGVVKQLVVGDLVDVWASFAVALCGSSAGCQPRIAQPAPQRTRLYT